MSAIKEYISQHKNRFVEELIDFLKIPSVSADPTKHKEMKMAAEWLANQMELVGIEAVEIFPTKGHPIVYGEKLISPNLPTVLVYGHYDVQPPDPLELWESGPFEPVIKTTDIHPNGAIFARGACDDKGQVFMHIKSFETLQRLNQIPLNIKFMIEGEEEVGSSNLELFCTQNQDKLQCDVVLISDTSLLANDIPSITTGLRGLSYLEVEVTGPNRDLHSGVYGGAVGNPINILAKMIASLTDENNRIVIPGFYDKVEKVEEEERMKMNQAPFDQDEYNKALGIKSVHGEAGYTTLERTTIRPTLDVNGIWGGYTGEGAKTVLPSKAFAKISMRLVPHQNPDEITQLFARHFETIAPPSVHVKITPHHGGFPVVTPVNTPEYEAAALAMKDTFGKEPIPLRGGGSIPIVALFENTLGVKSILMGFGLDSDAIHSPNEHYGIYNFITGIETISSFYHHYATLKS